MLRLARVKRVQIKFIKDFILTCRFAEELKNDFEKLPTHFTTDIEIYSMADFAAIKSGSFSKDINALIVKSDEHILGCELCLARGFICELCTKKQIIFPWQNKIKRCNDCGSCYHEGCWKNDCVKCQRLTKRQQQLDNI